MSREGSYVSRECLNGTQQDKGSNSSKGQRKKIVLLSYKASWRHGRHGWVCFLWAGALEVSKAVLY